MVLTTGIVIFAPREVQAIAVPIMRQFAPESRICIPAHITLMFPFVAQDRLNSAAQIVKSICDNIEPFDIMLGGYGQFPGTIFMQPSNPEPIKAVFRRIYAAFPECPPYGGAFGDDIHPHVTVGEFKSEDEQRTVWLPDYAPITFRAERLHLIYDVYDDPLLWITHSVIPFKG
jgi:2'-5' RNA ligase